MTAICRRSSRTQRLISALGPFVCLALLLVTVTAVVWAQDEKTAPIVDKDQAARDWADAARLVKEWSSSLCCQNYFDKDPQGFVERWIPFKKKFDPFWEIFSGRYGSNYHEISSAFEGVSQPMSVEYKMDYLLNELFQIPDHQKNIVNWATSFGEKSYREWLNDKEKTPHPHKIELWLDRANRALNAFTAAQKIDPDNAELIERIALAESAVKESQVAFEKNLSHPDLAWKGNNPDWVGDGGPDDLCAAAMDFLKKNPEKWGDAYQDDPAEPIAIYVISKDWKVWKEAPLTRQPMQYSLDFGVAFQGKKDKNIAYHYHYTFYTKEEAGVKKSPPFYYANPHQYAHYKMLASNIPSPSKKDVAKASAESSASASTDDAARVNTRPTRGFIGFLFRIVLALALILGGFVAAGPFFEEKFPALADTIDSFAQRRDQVGIGLFAIGVILFLRATFLYFSPLTDLLPHVTAVLVGLFLGWEFLLQKSAPMEQPEGPVDENDVAMGQTPSAVGRVVQKIHDLLEQHTDRIHQLEQKQVPIGIAAMVIGLFHLMIGGVWLF